MIDRIEEFKEQYPSLESYWRSIILFGKNTATYKFALAKALLELANNGKTRISLEELAIPYYKNICLHLQKKAKQTTTQHSQFIETCKAYNEGKINEERLLEETLKNGFKYVLDAFHTVNNDSLPIRFYQKDFEGRKKNLILTDNLFKLKDTAYSKDYANEVESRWNLVETAFELSISRNLLNIEYNNNTYELFVQNDFNRTNITSVRGALNGYQKGKCFYCFDDITIEDNQDNLCDVDHFFPFVLQTMNPDINLNGVWNLVLTCQKCNRGENGKFAKVPCIKYLERLHKRNEFLIESHHPLRETIINQTGQTEEKRKSFLKMIDQRAINILIQRWETKRMGPEIF